MTGVQTCALPIYLEAEQTTPFVERDAPLAHESAYVAYRDSKMLSEVLNGNQVSEAHGPGCRRP